MILQVEHLTKRYGRFTAVDDVSFSVEPGEVFAFLGPNGGGKTTTMKSIVGLTMPTSGRVCAGGLDVGADPREARRLMSYLPQRVAFPEALTAREVVRFYGRMRGIDERRADRALEQARFNGAADRAVGEFSGGMVQRLGLAIAAMAEAPILLLDEPTASLDPEGVKRFREFVLAQKAEGRTVLFSTHLLPEVEQLADRVGIFVAGRLVACTSIADVRRTFLVNGTVEDMYLHYVGADHATS